MLREMGGVVGSENLPVRCSYPRSKRGVSPRFLEVLREAYDAGKGYCCTTFPMPDAEDCHVSRYFPGRFWKNLEQLGCNHPGVRRAAYAMFFYGLCSYGVGADSSARSFWGARSQRELVRALLALPRMSRTVLASVAPTFGIDPRDWSAQFTGAVAVARVAYALMQKGLWVYHPTLRDDVIGKIDLVACDSPFSFGSCGMCLQIKGEGTSRATLYTVLGSGCMMSEKITIQYQRTFVSGVQCFQQKWGGTWVPVHFVVGVDADQYKCVENSGSVHWFVRQLLSEVFRELAP